MSEKLGSLAQPPKTFSFPKNKRLLKRGDFKIPLDQGRKAVDQYLVMVAVKSSGSGARLGLIVSKKVGSAVIRNRVKRLLREHFRHIQHSLPPMDIVVIARPPAAGRSLEEIAASFDRCLGRLIKKMQAGG